MNIGQAALTRTLQPQEFLHIAPGERVCLRAESGSLWVTIDGEPADIEMDAGESRAFRPQRPMIVGTLGGPAVVTLTSAGHLGWRERLAVALGRPAWRVKIA